MTSKRITLKIEGEFVDSFLYSGTLFLVGADSRLAMYDWEAVLKNSIGFNDDGDLGVFNFLLDSRRGMATDVDGYSEISVAADQLAKYLLFDVNLGEWPTDINVYANRFYVAGENGVDEIPYDWVQKTLKIEEKFRIWNKYSYKVSANDSHRIAIASGKNGVISAFPRSGYIKKDDVSTLLEVNSNDCQWIGANLVANSLEGSYLATFPNLPDRPHGPVPQGYWKLLESTKRDLPVSEQLHYDGMGRLLYSWLGGTKVFSLLDSGVIVIKDSDESDAAHTDSKLDVLRIEQTISGLDCILSARSGAFGTVVETDAQLLSITQFGVEVIAERPVSWRVFPRAKNYANHLHVAFNDHLSISAYFNYGSEGMGNKFGFDIDEAGSD